MPNGGSDCCATCWFNTHNRGQRGFQDSEDPHYCQIRDVAISDPFYSYCANHPHRRPERDPIPIGLITRHVVTDALGGGYRELLLHSPDSEAIRQHLLDLLGSIFTLLAVDRYPIGDGAGHQVIWQLGEFKEERAEQHLRWICENVPDLWGEVGSEALEKITRTD